MAPIPSSSPSDALHTASALLRRTSSSLSQRAALILWYAKRQTTTIIPADYSNENSSLPPGTIVGIVLGAVAGFLLLLWIIYTLMGGQMFAIATVSEVDSVVIRERKRSHRGSSRRGSSHTARETVEVRRERVVPVVERIVVEERRESRPVQVESSVDSVDEVVVIEEHSPPPRRKSTRVKEVREVREVREERERGYRTVDPLAYGGGDRPLRDVSRRGSGRSRG